MQPVQVVVGEASPGLGLVVVVALSLMSTSAETSDVHLRRPVRTPPFRRRGLSWTQRAGVVVVVVVVVVFIYFE